MIFSFENSFTPTFFLLSLSHTFSSTLSLSLAALFSASSSEPLSNSLSSASRRFSLPRCGFWCDVADLRSPWYSVSKKMAHAALFSSVSMVGTTGRGGSTGARSSCCSRCRPSLVMGVFGAVSVPTPPPPDSGNPLKAGVEGRGRTTTVWAVCDLGNGGAWADSRRGDGGWRCVEVVGVSSGEVWAPPCPRVPAVEMKDEAGAVERVVAVEGRIVEA